MAQIGSRENLSPVEFPEVRVPHKFHGNIKWQPDQLARQAVVQRYDTKSSKHARYRPANPDKKPLGEPKIRKLNAREQ